MSSLYESRAIFLSKSTFFSGSETTFVFNGWSVSGYQEYNDEGVYAWQDMTFIAQFAEAKDGLKYRREYNWEIISTDPWEEKETSTYTVLGYYEDVTNLAIPNEINGFPVTRVSQKALFECDSLTSLTLPDNMLYIESSAFSHCTNLSSIYLNDGLLSIGDSAFCMSAIYSIYIPLSVTTIGKSAFIQQSSKSSPAPTHYIEYYCAASERPSGWTYSPNGSNSYGNYWNAYNYRNVSGKTSYTYQTPESHIHWGSTR